ENMILPKEILQELYWWQAMIARNQEMTLEVKIPEAVMVSNASPKDWSVTLELQTCDTLVQHGEWNNEQKKWTNSQSLLQSILAILVFEQWQKPFFLRIPLSLPIFMSLNNELFLIPFPYLVEVVMFPSLGFQERFPVYQSPPLIYSEFP
ncbi:MAG: hypothetical protein EZS28_053042, partial [Streblomastix strix]